MTSATTPPTARPTVVTVAFWLQVSLVAALLLVVAASTADAIHHNGLIDEAVRTTSTPDTTAISWEREDTIASLLFVAVPMFVLAVWLGVSALLVRRGSNIGRVLTWVGVGGPALFVLLSCLLGTLGILTFAMIAIPFEDPSVYEDDPGLADPGDVAFTEGVYLDGGGWSLAYDIITAVGFMLALLLAVAVAVLLLTRPAARYFRRDEPERRPPMPFLPYGTTPAPYAAGPYAAPAAPYAAAPAPYAAAPGPYGAAPGPYGAAPGPYGAAPGSYYPAPGPFVPPPGPVYPYPPAPADWGAPPFPPSAPFTPAGQPTSPDAAPPAGSLTSPDAAPPAGSLASPDEAPPAGSLASSDEAPPAGSLASSDEAPPAGTAPGVSSETPSDRGNPPDPTPGPPGQ